MMTLLVEMDSKTAAGLQRVGIVTSAGDGTALHILPGDLEEILKKGKREQSLLLCYGAATR